MRFSKKLNRFLLLVISALPLLSFTVYANLMSIVGQWQTVDHETNKPSSLIRIWENHGKYFGEIAKTYSENPHQSISRCRRCRGNLHNKPILGMVIIRDLIAKADKYVDGEILDPRSGKYYRCQMTVADRSEERRVGK